MITGDILNQDIFDKVVNESIKNNCEFLIATPPCQGIVLQGKETMKMMREIRWLFVCLIYKKSIS